MKKIYSFLFIIGMMVNFVHAQNVGVGTSFPASKLHIASGNQDGVLIGNYNDQMGWNGTGPAPATAIRFAGYRDVVSNFTGAKIEAFRTDICCSALSQGTGLSFQTQPNTATVSGDGNLIEQMRITNNVRINSLAGSGTRVVTADANGVLGTATTAPTGQGVTTTTATNEVQLVGNNTGTYSGSAGAGWTIGTWQSTGVSITRTITSGSIILITLTARIEGDNNSFCPPSSAYFRLMRGTTEIGRTGLQMRPTTTNPSGFFLFLSSNLSMNLVDSGVSGSQTYTLEYWLANDNGACSAESVFLGERYFSIVEIRP